MPIEYKECYKCHAMCPVDHFRKSARNGKPYGKCRACRKPVWDALREKKREKLRAYDRDYYRRRVAKNPNFKKRANGYARRRRIEKILEALTIPDDL